MTLCTSATVSHCQHRTWSLGQSFRFLRGRGDADDTKTRPTCTGPHGMLYDACVVQSAALRGAILTATAAELVSSLGFEREVVNKLVQIDLGLIRRVSTTLGVFTRVLACVRSHTCKKQSTAVQVSTVVLAAVHFLGYMSCTKNMVEPLGEPKPGAVAGASPVALTETGVVSRTSTRSSRSAPAWVGVLR